MKTFYTITDVNTKYCNSRSKRFDTIGEAIEAAGQRLNKEGWREGVVVMKAVKHVAIASPPIKVEDIA